MNCCLVTYSNFCEVTGASTYLHTQLQGKSEVVYSKEKTSRIKNHHTEILDSTVASI